MEVPWRFVSTHLDFASPNRDLVLLIPMAIFSSNTYPHPHVRQSFCLFVEVGFSESMSHKTIVEYVELPYGKGSQFCLHIRPFLGVHVRLHALVQRLIP